MKKFVLPSLGCLGLLLGLGTVGLYWLTRPANIDWHRRSRDGFSDLRAVHWQGKNLAGANLSGILFRESWLNEANFRNANLQGTDFSGATYIDDANFTRANLTGAKLQGTYARRTNFTGATLKDANLNYANLTGANLNGVDLEGADLSHAILIGAKLTDWVNPPRYLDRANLTDADLPNWPTALPHTRLCNTIMPNGKPSKQGCLWPNSQLKWALHSQDWRWAERYTNGILSTGITANRSEQSAQAPLEDMIKRLPCQDLKVLNNLWHDASNGQFSFSQQRQIWEGPTVQKDYGKFADVVGWRRQGRWLKSEELQLNQVKTNNRAVGHLPWHGWQVQGPTEEQPTRFRRVGFGAWMGRLKQCGI